MNYFGGTIFCGGEWALEISYEKFPTAKFLPTWGLNQMYCPGL